MIFDYGCAAECIAAAANAPEPDWDRPRCRLGAQLAFG